MKKLLVIMTLSIVGLTSCGTSNKNDSVNTEQNEAVKTDVVEENNTAIENTNIKEDFSAKWEENQPKVQVLYGYNTHNMYEVAYNTETKPDADTYSRGEDIYMLMVDGGFVPHNEIIMKNDTAMIPTDILEEVLGFEVTYSNEEDKVTLTKDEVNLVFNIAMGNLDINGEYFESTPIEFNGATYEEGATAFYRNSEIYVPLEFVAKTFNAEVEYEEDYKLISHAYTDTEKSEDYKSFKIVTIETTDKNKYEKVYTVEEGIESLKQAAVEMYGENHIASTSNGEVDMWNIIYTNYDLGRYYVYEIKGLEDQLVYFNKYTGEIFYSPTGSMQYFMILDGFLNIPQN